MASTIEARSLSTLTDLAANPPLDPGHPLQGHFGPLTLYIARVPGSRDIFLTTLKTRDKVVSAHDVGSCLYYLHVDSPDDELLKETILTEEAQLNLGDTHIPDTLTEERTTTVHRKPLPSKPPLALGNHPWPPTKVSPDFHPPLTNLGQVQVTQTRPETAEPPQSNALHATKPPLPRRPHDEVSPSLPARSNAENSMPPLPPRRLQGPRPLHSRNESVDAATLGRDLRKENVNPRRWSEQPDRRANQTYRSSSEQSYDTRLVEKVSLSRPTKPSLSITLIRRDPATGEQWNVGRIVNGPVSTDCCDSVSSQNLSSPHDRILVQLSAPGYYRFSKGKSSRNSYDMNYPGPASQGNETSGCLIGGNDIENFYRILQLGKSNAIPDSPLPRRSEFGSSLDTRPETRSSKDSSRSHSQVSYFQTEDESSVSRYYSFLSPWYGNCTFITSATGKSIKCRHKLPPGLQNRSNNASLDSSGQVVSELRINLPNTKAFKLKARDRKRPTLSKFSRSGGIQSTPQLPSHPQSGLTAPQATHRDDASSEDERMDLSLGQERAGGGFGGKKAKLGKLIVECEGLKMLDLLVAVNMAIWWKVYD